MPIVVKDFTWTQSEKIICINLPLKGTKSTNLDVLNSLEFCKVSYPPFLFECWFYENIKDEECLALVKDGIICLQFEKQEENIWPNLFHSDFENKELVKIKREEAILFVGKRAELLAKKKAEDIAENKKIALKEQMKLEEDQRKHIENIKENERKKTSEEIEKFKKAYVSSLTNSAEQNESRPPELVPANESIKDNKFVFNDLNESDSDKKEKELPAPRSSSTIQIKFTPRVFPTPSRESQDQKEKEWLEKQAEARKLVDLPDYLQDLTPNEKNLDFLKEKANNLYKQENYQEAIGVYNHAIKIFPKVPALYSNRAACHYKVRNLMKCLEDCTRALDLLTPPVQENALSRLKAHIRRGTAFCELEMYPEGLLDYEAALKIDPNNRDIIEDAENIRRLIVGTPPDF